MFEISDILLKLGIIEKELRYSDERKGEDPGLLAIDSNYFDKLTLLEEILYNQHLREDPLFLDRLVKELENESIRTHTIKSELNIKDNLIFFNDIEILVHAISIKYPEKLPEIHNIIEKNHGKTNNSKIIDKSSNESVKIGGNVLYHLGKKLFTNTINGKEYNIKGHGNYEPMMDLLLANLGEYVPYSSLNQLDVMNTKSASREAPKKITDTKDNLHKNLRRRLELDKTFSFIETNNGLKIVLK